MALGTSSPVGGIAGVLDWVDPSRRIQVGPQRLELGLEEIDVAGPRTCVVPPSANGVSASGRLGRLTRGVLLQEM